MIEQDGVFKVTAPRSDVKFSIDGFAMPPFMGLASYAAFKQGCGSELMVMGAWRTIQRAHKALSIEVKRGGFGKNGAWTWRLPPKAAKETIDRHTNCVAAFDPVGGLCEKKFEPDYEEF